MLSFSLAIRQQCFSLFQLNLKYVCIQMFKHICKQLTSSVIDSEVRSLRSNLVVRDVRVFIRCGECPHMSPGWLLLEQIQSVERAVPRPGRRELRSKVVHINDRYN